MNFLILLVLFGGLLSTPSQSTIPLYILWGESTMDGRSDTADVTSAYSHLLLPFPAVRIWNRNTVQLEPLESNVNNSQQNDGNFGPELEFAARLVQGESRPYAMVKVTMGGSALNPAQAQTWDPATPGSWYEILTQAVSAAITDLETEGWTVEVKSINGMIGLNDADDAGAAVAFESRLQNFIDNLYTDLSLPSTTPFLLAKPHVSATVLDVASVRTGTDNIEAANNQVYVFSVDDLPLADGLHFGATEDIEVGDRFYDNQP